MAKNQGTALAATTTKKTKDLGDPNGLFTFVNDGAGSVFLRQQDEGRAFAGTAAEINALGGGQLKAGRTVTVKGVTWDYVCGSDTGTTATVQVLPGVVGASTVVELSGLEVNLGNVGLLNAAETEIDPSEAQAANTAYVAADKLTPIGGVKSAARHTAAELETFADDDWVPVGVTAVHELRTRDDDANTVLGAIDADTGAIKTAVELIDHLTAANSGNKDANTQRVVIATDDIPIAALNTLITAGNLNLAAAAKGGLANSVVPAITSKVNATAIVDTTSVDSTPLAASTTPYIKATVTARTASADANTISTANTTDVYILTTADDLRTAWAPLAPGQEMDLPDNCDLADFHLAVVTATEGVIISYTV